MIRYALICEAGHGFESWFRDSAAFDAQAQAGLLACPNCPSIQITKQIMRPSVANGTAYAPATPAPVALMGESEQAMRAMLRAFHTHLHQHARDVGSDFADEARKIHCGESEEAAIYGLATPEETQALHDDGIDVMAIPALPDDKN